MAKVFYFFARRIARTSALVFALGVVMPLFLEMLKVPFEVSVVSLLYCGVIFAILSQLATVNRNLTWLMAVPLTKAEIVWLNAALRSLGFLAHVSSLLLAITVVVRVRHPEFPSNPQWREMILNIVRNALGESFDCFALVGLILGFDCFLAICLSVNRTDAEAVASRLSRVNRQIVIGVLGVLAIGVPLFLNIESVGVFLGFVMVNTILGVATVVASKNALGVGRRQLKRWWLYLAALLLVQDVGVLVHAYRQFNTGAPIGRVRAMEFLGWFSPRLSERDYADMIEGELSAPAIELVGKAYRERHRDFSTFDPHRNAPPRFDTAVAMKHDPNALLSTVILFNPLSYRVEDIDFVLDRFQELTHNNYLFTPGYFAIPTKLPPKVVIEHYLNSESERYQAHGLARARFYRDPAFIPVIEKHLAGYSAVLRPIAEATLWVLYGQKTDTFSKHPFAEIDCSEYHPRTVSEITPDGLTRLNVCLRERSARAWYDQIAVSDAGWYHLPLAPAIRRAMQETFGTYDDSRASARRDP